MEAGTLHPAELLGLQHMIVDEFQDLNPMDLQYVDGLAAAGVTVFVAGDDDQSLYSFRFASPAGIQNFVDQYAGAGDHELDACFRCTPAVVAAGRGVIEAHHMENRIPKDLGSLYRDADPPVEGAVACWRFATGRKEAEGIAASCVQLLDRGLSPRAILILLSNQRAQGPDLFRALEEADVAFEKPRPEPFRDTEAGRLVFAFARIVTNPFDYVAHRAVLGQQRGVGVATCSNIARKVVEHNLNYRDLFHAARPEDVFTSREEHALQGAETLIAELESWAETDELAGRTLPIGELLETARDEEAKQAWFDYATTLPPRMTLGELSTFLVLDKDEQQEHLLIDVYRRLQEEAPADLMPPRIRIMSMHGAKGLSASVVVIPGLEEEILPGPRRRPYPGLVLEAGRMLYVSITRARHTCILSYASRRFINGAMRGHAPSRFTTAVGTPFSYRDGGLSQDEAAAVVAEVALL
jgi:DNA helicase-2/ATP-dependent DNA helicase PcrA